RNTTNSPRPRRRTNRSDRRVPVPTNSKGTQTTMTFNPHTAADRREMLRSVGVDSIEALFTAIPETIRFPTLDLPPVLTDMEAAARLMELAARNVVPNNGNT